MNRTYTCIICPIGCEITAETEGCEIKAISGNRCEKGKNYVWQELTCPMRNIATSVKVKNGVMPLASVRLTAPIPREKIAEAVAEIHKCSVTAPVQIGQVVISKLLGYDADVIITRSVDIKEE
ncbi:MAG: DUF1667 domain-containing protein [Ruminococcaceae bacterium]|nr:DUF1667 domain-containing protein [Oscillospiraceae bacterium]